MLEIIDDVKSTVDDLTRIKNVVSLLIDVSLRNQDELRQLQKQHHFDRDRIVVVEIKDFHVKVPFQVKDGVLVALPLKENMPEPDVLIIITHLCTLKHVRNNSICVRHPTTGDIVSVPFGPTAAWKHGFVSASSRDPRIMNEAFMASFAITNIMSLLDKDKVNKAIGPCQHDFEFFKED